MTQHRHRARTTGRHRADAFANAVLIAVATVVLVGVTGLAILNRVRHDAGARPVAAQRNQSSGQPTGALASTGSARAGGAPAVGSTPAHVTASPTLQAPAPAAPASGEPAEPVSVSVPSVGIASSLERLGLESDGSLQAPSEFGRAGWYARGVRPGALGPAVIAGHVDSRSGPAVFFTLTRVKIGAAVRVRDATGEVRQFVVTDIRRYPKSSFPKAAVYGPTAFPVVRLITCTGVFDLSHHSYLDNLVVTARLVAARAA